MKKLLFVLISLVCYLIFFGTFLYLIGFVENLYVPKTIDSGSSSGPLWASILINLGLLALFGFQHSTMARKGFKEAWTRIIPQPIERSVYVLSASLVLIIFMLGWQPIGFVVWDFSGGVLGKVFLGISGLGWLIVLLSTFLINHFHLFGLFQAFKYMQGKGDQSLKFKAPFLYKMVRHPLYLGFIIAFWFAPKMTAGHLFFSIIMTAYIMIAITMEEKDLIDEFGGEYEKYRKNVPKIVPLASAAKD